MLSNIVKSQMSRQIKHRQKGWGILINELVRLLRRHINNRRKEVRVSLGGIPDVSNNIYTRITSDVTLLQHLSL